jgi:hypothetical protein
MGPTLSISQTRKLRLRKVKRFTHMHTASEGHTGPAVIIPLQPWSPNSKPSALLHPSLQVLVHDPCLHLGSKLGRNSEAEGHRKEAK